MPITKLATIPTIALLLAFSSIAQAKTEFNLNQISKAERQRMLQEAVAKIYGRLPSTSYDGSNSLNRIFIEKGLRKQNHKI